MKERMRSRAGNFTQSHAKRLFKAAAAAGVDVTVEFRPDGTIVATAHKPVEADAAVSDSPEEIQKLI
jgi:hypothetical protein